MLIGRQNDALDRVILPWEAVHSKVTQECYERRSRQFLVFAEYMDPALWSHGNPTRLAAEAERIETERAMLAFIRAGAKDPGKVRQQVLSFIDYLRRRMNDKDASKRITSAQARNLLKPIKLALEMNEVALPWKKFLRVIPGNLKVDYVIQLDAEPDALFRDENESAPNQREPTLLSRLDAGCLQDGDGRQNPGLLAQTHEKSGGELFTLFEAPPRAFLAASGHGLPSANSSLGVSLSANLRAFTNLPGRKSFREEP